MRNLAVFSLVVLTFIGSRSIAAAQRVCDKQFVVSQVDLPATTQLSRSEQAAIRAQLIGRCFDYQQIGDLSGPVRNMLQSFGYFRATISEPTLTIVDASRHPQLVSLSLEPIEGARYKVHDITWTGMKAVSTEQIVSISQLHPEDILDMSKVRQTVEAVGRLYAAMGYPQASIVPQVEAHEAGHWVSLYFSIVEGEQVP